MMPSLCNSVIIGPIESGRNGRTLVINLMSSCSRRCIFNCETCDYFKDVREENAALPEPYAVVEALMKGLQKELNAGRKVDNICFAGTGEPSLHPKFPEIMEDVVLIRNLLSPDTHISLVTNAKGIQRSEVMNTMMKVNHFIFKYDPYDQEVNDHGLLRRIAQLKSHLKGEFSIQSIFYDKHYRSNGKSNTRSEHVERWASQIARLNPVEVVLYEANGDLLLQKEERAGILQKAAEKLQTFKIKTRLAQNERDPLV